jgi:DNA-binding NarL/FixJ family response regulator
MSQPEVKLLVVDDHAVLRLGLTALFGDVPHIAVVGEAGTAAEAVAEARRCRPDVVLMDVRLPDGSGVEACREIRAERPATKVIMLTSYADDDAVVASVMAGAAGYFLKQTHPERLIEAVETVAGGGSLLDPEVTEAVLGRLRQLAAPAHDDPLTALSEQERKVLPLIAEGKTNREIAAALALNEHTVKHYVTRILRKLRLTRRVEAAAFAARLPEPQR